MGLFHKNKSTSDGLTAECKSCRNKYFDTGRKKADSNLRARFNISIEEYELLLTSQGGGCYVCGMKPRSKRLSVDHDHSQAREYGSPGIRQSVRGLLCRTCNRWFGQIKDDSAMVERARYYLDDKKRPFA